MLLALLLACDSGEAPPYTAADLAKDLVGHEGWPSPAAWPGVQPSCVASHGEYVAIRMNAVAAADVAAGRAYSEGAIYVLDAYQDTVGTPKMFVVMRKQPGARGAWFWGHYDEARTLVDAGDLAGCAACHAAGTDRVRHAGQTPPADVTTCRELPRDTADTAIPAPG